MQLDIQLLALFCGHFLGDFVFQSDKLVERKKSHLKWMFFHVALVAMLTWLFLGNLSVWWVIVVLCILHLLIDSIKIWITPKERPRKEKNSGQPGRLRFYLFIGDQVVHVLVILALWSGVTIFMGSTFPENSWEMLLGDLYAKGLFLLTGLAIGVFGVGVVLKYQMSEYAGELGAQAKQGLPRGGNTIGILERLLVFMFVLAGKPEGVGFIIAAKSVFRIGALTNREERDHAEYIMIGTLQSFTYSLAFAFITKWLIDQL